MWLIFSVLLIPLYQWMEQGGKKEFIWGYSKYKFSGLLRLLKSISEDMLKVFWWVWKRSLWIYLNLLSFIWSSWNFLNSSFTYRLLTVFHGIPLSKASTHGQLQHSFFFDLLASNVLILKLAYSCLFLYLQKSSQKLIKCRAALAPVNSLFLET